MLSRGCVPSDSIHLQAFFTFPDWNSVPTTPQCPILLFPVTWPPSFSFLSLWILIYGTTGTSWVKSHNIRPFCDWLILLNIMFSRFIHVTCVRTEPRILNSESLSHFLYCLRFLPCNMGTVTVVSRNKGQCKTLKRQLAHIERSVNAVYHHYGLLWPAPRVPFQDRRLRPVWCSPAPTRAAPGMLALSKRSSHSVWMKLFLSAVLIPEGRVRDQLSKMWQGEK